MRWLTLILVGILATSAASAVRGAPEVQIRGKTRIAIEKVRKTSGNQIEVIGQLVDLMTGEGVPHQAITIRLGGLTAETVTSKDGHFETYFPVVPGQQPIEILFTGGTFLDPATHSEVIDPARQQVALIIRSDPSANGITLTVAATVDDAPATLPLTLMMGEPDAPNLEPLATLASGAPFEVTRQNAKGTGSRRVRAVFAGDSLRQSAAAELTFDLTAATTTTMTLSDTDLAYEDELVISGRVTDEDNQPVARAAITLASGERRLAQSATDETGAYRFEIEGEVLGAGDIGLQVSADPSTPYLRPSRAAPAAVHVNAPQPVPIAYTLAAALATALAIVGFFVARAKPWERFRRKPQAADAPDGAGEGDHTAGGLVTNRPGIVSTLRRAYDDGFSGAVRDTVRARPVAGAIVRLTFGEDTREAETAPDGTFTFDKLAVGDWKCEVLAPGHITERFAVSIPHRGELRGVRVDLVPVRERVFQLYRRAAEPVLPETRLWGIWSPRQIVDHVRTKQPSPALAELTDFVEEVYFSPRLAPETVLPTASERVDRAVRERRPGRPPAPPA